MAPQVILGNFDRLLQYPHQGHSQIAYWNCFSHLLDKIEVISIKGDTVNKNLASIDSRVTLIDFRVTVIDSGIESPVSRVKKALE